MSGYVLDVVDAEADARDLAAFIDLALDADYVDLFAGPGGWDVAAEALGLKGIGFEWDASAVRTRRAVGHLTCQADIASLDPTRYFSRGQIGSPPCQGFSTAGKGKSRADSVHLLEALEDVTTLADLERVLVDLAAVMTDERTLLALEPLRWALAVGPEWVAWEQVPAVLPLWEACAAVLRRAGYDVVTGTVTAEQYGVPQTRRRAVLLARSAMLARILGPVRLPAPTHSKYHVRSPERLDDGVPPWVSMAEALGWGMDRRPSMTVTGGGGDTGGAEPFGNGARQSMKREREAGRWTVQTGQNSIQSRVTRETKKYERSVDVPSPCITGQTRNWKVGERINNQSGTAYDVDEQVAQPATALAGRGLVGFRGANANRFNGSTKSRNDGLRVSVEEAATLQTFPDGYDWQGSKTQQFQQVGNAVPPLLAYHLLTAAAITNTKDATS